MLEVLVDAEHCGGFLRPVTLLPKEKALVGFEG
jgi:hypothetical protein